MDSTPAREFMDPKKNQETHEEKAPAPLAASFADVSIRQPPVYASPYTAANLLPAEKAVLAKAGHTILLLTPQDVLVKKDDGTLDQEASIRTLDDSLNRFLPKGAIDQKEKLALFHDLEQIDQDPLQASGHSEPHACIVLFQPDLKQGFTERQFTSLPEEILRPEKVAAINNTDRVATLAHELGHCIPSAPDRNNTALFGGQVLSEEAKADTRGFVLLNALDKKTLPQKKEAIQDFMDQRAISGMITNHDSLDYRIHTGMQLSLNEHATIGLLLRPSVSPVTALLAPGLANRAIYHVLGEQRVLEDDIRVGNPENYKNLKDEKEKTPAVYDRDIEELGEDYAQQNPLLHYAAAKALLEEGYFQENSLAHLNVEQYVNAMERMVKPDILRDNKVYIDEFRTALRRTDQPLEEKLTVTVAKEQALTLAVLANRRNAPHVEPVATPVMNGIKQQ